MEKRICYLSIDFEDFSFNLQRSLGVKTPKPRLEALQLSIDRILSVIDSAPGSNHLTFFTTGQVARDCPEIIAKLARNGHEIGCHSYYHDNINASSKEWFAKDLDKAIKIIKKSSGQEVYGFRAPNFSIDKQNNWAYEELAKRFLYDSSYVSESRLNSDTALDVMNFHNYKLYEFSVYSHQLFPGFKVRVIGGTFLKLLPLKLIIKLMNRSLEKGYIPIIYLHPYEFLYNYEFWVGRDELRNISFFSKVYWQIRQHQWLRLGNKKAIIKLSKILEIFNHQGNMVSHFTEKERQF
jgi:peptidoglycan/xylan/chitin deacetylase (PgdA/CDA1 family)